MQKNLQSINKSTLLAMKKYIFFNFYIEINSKIIFLDSEELSLRNNIHILFSVSGVTEQCYFEFLLLLNSVILKKIARF